MSLKKIRLMTEQPKRPFSLPVIQLQSRNPSTETSPAEVGGGEHEGSLLPAAEHVLSTLERDGRRRWLRPKLAQGIWWHRRRAVAYVLMVIFIAVPHMRIGDA
ncbi:MAG: hypothetical protein KDB22_24755, partial [Planctomycetales bacterium]|nr:hypothetical protein [Planctomycetales bacterium]